MNGQIRSWDLRESESDETPVAGSKGLDVTDKLELILLLRDLQDGDEIHTRSYAV